MLRRGLLMFAACDPHAEEIDRDDWQDWKISWDSEWFVIRKG